MSNSSLDRFLNLILIKDKKNSHLDNLENDVLRKLATIRKDQELSWYEKIILSFSVPQFRVASLSIAILIGMSVSPFFTPLQNNSADTALVSNIFSAESTYLPVNLIERTK